MFNGNGGERIANFSISQSFDMLYNCELLMSVELEERYSFRFLRWSSEFSVFFVRSWDKVG